MSSLRCPYCHLDLTAEALEAVHCDACEASHHMDCVVEGGACAATGCGATRVRVGGQVLEVSSLAAWQADGERLEELTASRPPWKPWHSCWRHGVCWSVALLTLFCAWAFTPQGDPAHVARTLILPLIALLASYLATGLKPERVFTPGPVPTPPELEATCQDCGKGIAAVEGEAPLEHCYHCGATLEAREPPPRRSDPKRDKA